MSLAFLGNPERIGECPLTHPATKCYIVTMATTKPQSNDRITPAQIKHLRWYLGETQDEFAKRLKCSRSAVSTWECSAKDKRSRRPKPKVRRKLLKLYARIPV